MKKITYSIFTIEQNTLTKFSSDHKTKAEALELINRYVGEFIILEVYS
jgi:hypothetical protein